MPVITNCECEDAYYNFRNKIVEYNAYVSAHNLYINTPPLDGNIYPTFSSFVQAGRCTCAVAYITYLDSYLDPGTISLSPAVSINNFGQGCSTISENYASCYIDRYQDLIPDYHFYLATNIYGYVGLDIIVPKSNAQLVANDYCNCYEEYKAFIESFINGTADRSINWGVLPYKNRFNISNTCNDHAAFYPCTPVMSEYIVSSPVRAALEDPVYRKSQKYCNCKCPNSYNQYINNLTTDIARK